MPETKASIGEIRARKVGKPEDKRADTTCTVKPPHNYISASIEAAAGC